MIQELIVPVFAIRMQAKELASSMKGLHPSFTLEAPDSQTRLSSASASTFRRASVTDTSGTPMTP